MNGLGAEGDSQLVVDPSFAINWATKNPEGRKAMFAVIQAAEKERKKKLAVGWALGLAALGVGGYFVYTRYIQD